jgi:hypothetical protein
LWLLMSNHWPVAVLLFVGAGLEAQTAEPFLEVPTGVIVPARRAQHEAEPCLVECEETYWTPSPEAIAELETKLRPHLEERLREALAALEAVPAEKRKHSVQESQVGHLRNILGRLDQTARQYIGVLVGETRWIHVAGLPRDDRYDWRQRVAIVSDGGDWFWEATYRPDGPDAGFVLFGWHGEA